MGKNIWSTNITCGPLNDTLKVNQACFKIFSNLTTILKFYMKNIECFKCDFFLQRRPVLPQSTTSYIIDTTFGFESYFLNANNNSCKMKNYFEDFGIYSLNISENGCSDIKVLREPEKLLNNIGFSVCVCILLLAIFWTLKFIYNYCDNYFSSNISLRELEMDLGNPNTSQHRKNQMRHQFRIISVDAFRGLAITLMIFINYGGGEYSFFKHTPWNGLKIADLVFPWFVWIMGASLVFSLRSNIRTCLAKKVILWKILKRSVILIFLGLVLNSGKRDQKYLRVFGVLQRLGVTYFVVASIEILFSRTQINEQSRPWYYCQDLMNSWKQWLVVLCFTIFHELITFTLQVPGCPTGYLGPGGFSDHSLYRNCTGGSAGYIDRLLVTENHMYQHGTFVKIYKPTVAYDPEGLLGVLTSILCAFLGVHAAQIIVNFENPYVRIRKWLSYALVTGIVAGFLCNWSQNDGVVPINKNLWSLSYVLATSSLAFFILTIFYWFIDFSRIWTGFPFVFPGANAITLYLSHSILKNQIPWRWIPYSNTHFELLLMDLTATLVWLLISYVLYQRKIFITI